jgi:hypothetical protein
MLLGVSWLVDTTCNMLRSIMEANTIMKFGRGQSFQSADHRSVGYSRFLASVNKQTIQPGPDGHHVSGPAVAIFKMRSFRTIGKVRLEGSSPW